MLLLPLLLPPLLQAAQPAPVAVPTSAATPVCPATPAPLPADLAAWPQAGATPTIGRAFTLATFDPATARFAVPIDTSHRGRVATAAVTIVRAGTYQVAISRGAWIDVFGADNRALTSTAHRHGPDCSGIRKIVSFALTPGSYTLAFTGMMGHDIKVLVAPAP